MAPSLSSRNTVSSNINMQNFTRRAFGIAIARLRDTATKMIEVAINGISYLMGIRCLLIDAVFIMYLMLATTHKLWPLVYLLSTCKLN